mgnify:CR=1 FL=1
MKNLILIFVIGIIVFQSQSYGQEVQDDKAKNAIYANLGFIGLGGGINGNYERALRDIKILSIQSRLSVRVGGGYWGVWGGSGSHAITSLSATTIKSKHRFEVTTGLGYFFNKESYDIGVSNAEYFNEPAPSRLKYFDVVPNVSAGYRYQKLNKGLIFRTGLSYPEGLYLSLGYGF